ncbi:MAG: hypothetical protein NC452_05705 [Eubacterium sp.]|nr:hypothetical protein [Eubacterium sp.]
MRQLLKSTGCPIGRTGRKAEYMNSHANTEMNVETASENPDSLKRAVSLIEDYYEEYIGDEFSFYFVDLNNKSKVDLAYTTENEIPVQVYADLEKFRLVKEYGGVVVSEEKYDTLDEFCDKALSNLEFDALVALSDEEIAIWESNVEKPTVTLMSDENEITDSRTERGEDNFSVTQEFIFDNEKGLAATKDFALSTGATVSDISPKSLKSGLYGMKAETWESRADEIKGFAAAQNVVETHEWGVYQVVTFDHESGTDEKYNYRSLSEAVETANGYVKGTVQDTYGELVKYDGALVINNDNLKIEHTVGEIDVRSIFTEEFLKANGIDVSDDKAKTETAPEQDKSEVINEDTPPEIPHFKVEADKDGISARKAEILEASEQNRDKFLSSLETSEKLLPLLNVTKELHSSRLKTLNHKNAVQSEKLAKNESKLERLAARAEKLQAANEMLGSIFPKSLPIRAMIEKNNARIEKIEAVKIPNCEAKINERVAKINLNNRKIDKVQCKVDKLENLSKAIRSFGITDGQERRRQFSQAMDGLRDASMRAIMSKIERYGDKIDALSDKYQTASIPDRLGIAEALKKQISKKQELNGKLGVLAAHAKNFDRNSETAVDNAAEAVKAKCADYEKALAENAEAPKLDDFVEDVCVSACKSLDDLKQSMETQHSVSASKEAVKPDTVHGESEKSKPQNEKPESPAVDSEERRKFYADFATDKSADLPVYSEKNIERVYEQMPEATAVAGKSFWESQGYSLNKGAKGIEIIAPQTDNNGEPVRDDNGNPVFTTATVYDISETNAFEKSIGGKSAERDTHGKKPSILGSIKEIQSRQKAERQDKPPEKSQQKAKHKQEEIS